MSAAASYIIADLHLQEQNPELLQAFRDFVGRLHAGDNLYILGDLFNFFVGLDPQDVAQQVVRDTLHQAKMRGVTCFFQHGNRDFLLTAAEAQALNMTLLPDLTVRRIAGLNVLLAHGDDFCSNDASYQRYKRKVSLPWLQGLFRCLPLACRRRIGHNIRNRSEAENFVGRDPAIYGVVVDTVAHYCKILQKSDDAPVDVVVHGHIHALGQFKSEAGFRFSRYVLGAWGRSLSFCLIDAQRQVSLVEEKLP